uniref:Bestrophin homolog n=1 Tax=Daphnia galeata TaxID=27404 RepID=A0A8J2S1K0_9CRUS|nr:unnamed protein product [Daphnia galeata]
MWYSAILTFLMSSKISSMQYDITNERINVISAVPLNNNTRNATQMSTVIPTKNEHTKLADVTSILDTPTKNSFKFGESFLALFHWKGSIYKALWKHILIYYVLYYLLTIIHHVALPGEQKKTFEALAKYCLTNPPSPTNLIIMLSFFTTTAMQRRFSVQISMGGTAKLISVFIMGIKPNLPEGPIIVEHFARWSVLSWVLTYRIVCKPLRDLFPDMMSLQRAGIIQNNAERTILEKMETEGDTTPRSLIVVDWMLMLQMQSLKKGRFGESKYYFKSVETLLAYKKNCGNTIKFATKNIPYALIQYDITNERVNVIPLNNIRNTPQMSTVISIKNEHTKLANVTSILDTPTTDSSVFGESFLALFHWKGSIYKALWKHILIYYVLYYLLTIIHNIVLQGEQKKIFEALAKYCLTNPPSPTNLIIMLSFFTTTAMQRRFSVQISMGGTAKLISVFIMGIKPNLPEGPILVEHYARWSVLSWVLTYRIVCKPLRDLFPDMMSLQRAGIIQNNAERTILEKMDTEGDTTPRSLIVVDWMLLLLRKTLKKDRFGESKYYQQSVENLLAYKKNCGNTIKFATKNIPYALIQAAIIVVYVYGVFTLMARNFDGVDKSVLLGGIVNYFPAFSSIQFFIFLIWLNFGLTAVNPFGTDDDDIDVKQLLATHIQDSLRLAKLYNQDLSHFLGEMPQNPSVEGSLTQNTASAAK